MSLDEDKPKDQINSLFAHNKKHISLLSLCVPCDDDFLFLLSPGNFMAAFQPITKASSSMDGVATRSSMTLEFMPRKKSRFSFNTAGFRLRYTYSPPVSFHHSDRTTILKYLQSRGGGWDDTLWRDA